MFTGIIEESGKIVDIDKNRGKAFVEILCLKCLKESVDGDSISVNGVCMTITEKRKTSLLFDASRETVERSTFNSWSKGLSVNLEQALKADSKLGGHFVQGHVDCVSTIIDIEKQGSFRKIKIEMPAIISAYIVEKGPIAVDGISLTTAACNDNFFEVVVIPETIKRSNISQYEKGTKVNLEADLFAKYVEKVLSKQTDGIQQKNFYSVDNLKKIGFI